MPRRSASGRVGRRPLDRQRVVRAAVELTDEQGIDALTMRRLAQALGVEAMSLYNHVANKDDLLEGVADLVTAEFELPSFEADWKATLRRSATSAHEALLRHPWASSLIESRPTMGPARMRYVNAIVGVLREAGFSLPQAAQAIMALDSHTYGFALQELSWAFDPADAATVAATFAQAIPRAEYPYLHELVGLAATADGQLSLDFSFGLDLILDGLERARHEA